MRVNEIRLVDLLKILYRDEIVKIYMERPRKSDGYSYITTDSAEYILEDDETEYLLENDIRVVTAVITHDHDYGIVLEIIVKEIPNESE